MGLSLYPASFFFLLVPVCMFYPYDDHRMMTKIAYVAIKYCKIAEKWEKVLYIRARTKYKCSSDPGLKGISLYAHTELNCCYVQTLITFSKRKYNGLIMS